MTDRNEALRLADELAEEAARRVCHVAMAPASLLNEAADLLRQQAEQLDAELCNREVLDKMLNQCIAERDQLRAEVERLRPNAERYEWLRDNHESEWAICEWQDDPDGLGYYRDARASHIVDAAIDLARTHKETK